MSQVDKISKILNKNYSELEIKEIINCWLEVDYELLTKDARELERIIARKISSPANGQLTTIWSFIALAFYRWFETQERRQNINSFIIKEADSIKKSNLKEMSLGCFYEETEVWNHLQAALDLVKEELD